MARTNSYSSLKFFTPTIATYYGHLKQEQQNLQSTHQPTEHASWPEPGQPDIVTTEMMATITPYSVTKKVFGDLPGYFPFKSSQGPQFFLVIYHFDSYPILV